MRGKATYKAYRNVLLGDVIEANETKGRTKLRRARELKNIIIGRSCVYKCY